MSEPVQDCSIRILHWTVGLVVLVESCLLALEPARIQGFARTGFPHWIRPVLAWPEIVAVVLFLLPTTTRIGARVLLVIFGVAAALHLLHGRYDIGSLLVYTAAVLVVLRHGGASASNEVSVT